MVDRKKLVVFTGAGVSADSGIGTFRDEDGLWAKYRIEDVCTPEALARNRPQVLEFYNMRRKELLSKEPNAGHCVLKELEELFDVRIITQNIDDLHERAGSSNVLHLHGELRKLRSSVDDNLIYPIEGWEQDPEARCAKESLLRPFVVFFGESVPMFDSAVKIAEEADIFIVAGTSLAVYPAASLVRYVKENTKVYVVDPNDPDISGIRNEVEIIKMRAAEGLPFLSEKLKKDCL
ncbi:MAG: NAD-dependent deacylase [Rikenellaceae bacterium]|nr:NAD-dependent deacylase [Rikenellaceae bacterium]